MEVRLCYCSYCIVSLITASDDSSVISLFIVLIIIPLLAHLPLQLVQNVADMYLASEYKSVRLEAVKTCTALLVPALLPTTIFTQPFVQFSQTSASVVADVLKKLLSVGITDTGLCACMCVRVCVCPCMCVCAHACVYTMLHTCQFLTIYR